MSILIKSPLSIALTKKKQFILNLNNYRNLHYRLLNQSKINYKLFLTKQIEDAFYYQIEQAGIIYKVFKGDNRRFDIGNICSVHQKYFEDAIVELGKLKDDKASIIPITAYLYGGINKDNPRVEIEVFDLKDKTDKANFFKAIKEYNDR